MEIWQSAFGYTALTHPVVNDKQRVRVAFLQKADSITVKLVEPIDETSSVYQLSRRGGGLHHLCFRCADLDAEILRLKTLGLSVLAGPQPGPAFDNEPISFVYAGHGLNVELIATDKKTALLKAPSTK